MYSLIILHIPTVINAITLLERPHMYSTLHDASRATKVNRLDGGENADYVWGSRSSTIVHTIKASKPEGLSENDTTY